MTLNHETAVRKTAFALLREALSKEHAQHAEWTEHPDFLQMEPRERAACLNLTLTVLRHMGSIDALLAARMTKQPKGSHRAVLHLLRLGTAELLWLNTPAYAAVNSYVDLTRKQGFDAMTGLVNAVLKRIGEIGASELARLDAAKLDTPVWLWQRWSAAYGEENVRRIAAMHLQEPPLDVTVREAPERWMPALEAEALPTGSLRRRKGGQVGELPGYAEGAWWVQDAAAALPVKLFGEVRGKRALDMCAAPGGKTAQLAAAGAQVTALEPASARLARLQSNLARLQLEAECVETDAREYAANAPFDCVLLDAPCTATGTIRRHPEIAWMRSAEDVARLSELQRHLLGSAAKLTASGGLLVYATCSLEPEEGERQVERFLTEHPYFIQIPADAASLGVPAHWIAGPGYLRILPSYWEERGGTCGFFAALMKRGA